MQNPAISDDAGLPEKVLGLHATLADREVAHAFGGAIALAYHAEPRATDDIDVNILLRPDRAEVVIAALSDLLDVPNRDETLRQIEAHDQARVRWGQTYVDLFFTDTAFHESMATRIQRVEFGNRRIPIISAEDLTVCKALFNRPHDWSDIERISVIQGHRLDRSYVARWLSYFLGDSDPIIDRFQEV